LNPRVQAQSRHHREIPSPKRKKALAKGEHRDGSFKHIWVWRVSRNQNALSWDERQPCRVVTACAVPGEREESV
jgi:hypothetical protein